MYEFYIQKRFVARKFRTRLPSHCTDEQKELHGNCSIDHVKNEIVILKYQSAEFKEQHESVDNIMLQKLEKNVSG